MEEDENDDIEDAINENLADIERVEEYCEMVRNSNAGGYGAHYADFLYIPCTCWSVWDFGQSHEVGCRRREEQPYVRLPNERGSK